MKKWFLLLTIFCSITVFVTACTTAEPQSKDVEEIADEILLLLKNQDMKGLKPYIHPEKGIRLSPYSYISIEEDVVLSADQVEQGFADITLRNWGTYAGSGEPMELTFSEYFNRFIYDHDYSIAEQRAINERLGKGNSVDNSSQVYMGATIVEYHFPGFDPQFEGMDWRSLRLVLEQVGKNWYLIGIIHDEWTI